MFFLTHEIIKIIIIFDEKIVVKCLNVNKNNTFIMSVENYSKTRIFSRTWLEFYNFFDFIRVNMNLKKVFLSIIQTQ